MNVSRLSLALLPLAFAPLGCAQPVGQVSDQGDYNSYYESTGNEETAADEKPSLEKHEVHRESMDKQAPAEEMTAKTEETKTEEAKAEEAKTEEQTAAAEQPQTEEAAKEESAKTEQVSTEAVEEVKPEEVANQSEGTFKDESEEQSAHVDPPQSQLEVSLAEVEQELMKAKETLAKYSTQQEKKDFRNGAQKLLDETIDTNNKPLKEDIAKLKKELDEKQQRLDAITMLTDQVQEQIDQLDPTSAEPNDELREEIRKSLARLRQLKAESNGRRLASQY